MRGEMESLRRYYGVPAKRGGLVRLGQEFGARLSGREGVILSARDHKLWLRLDGDGRRSGPYHPTWEMEYIA